MIGMLKKLIPKKIFSQAVTVDRVFDKIFAKIVILQPTQAIHDCSNFESSLCDSSD